MRTASGMALWLALVFLPGQADAQDWRAALETEKAQNAQRVNVINTDAAPVAKSLREVSAQVAAHNANKPDTRSESAVNAYNARAKTLNNQQDALRSRLQAMVNELDRLKARNQEIERRLNCVQVPVACSLHSDCQCSGSCGNLGGGTSGSMGVCQPRSR